MFIIKTNDAKHSTLLTTHSKHFVEVFNTSSTFQCLLAGKCQNVNVNHHVKPSYVSPSGLAL